MATNQRKATSSPEDRKAARINETNKVSIAELKGRYFATPVVEMNLRMISTGYRWTYDEASDELVRGEELPIDVWQKINQMFFTKVVPATKEVTVEDTSGHADFIKQCIASDELASKKAAYLTEQDATFDVDAIGDCD